jgi:hypothetical protein
VIAAGNWYTAASVFGHKSGDIGAKLYVNGLLEDETPTLSGDRTSTTREVAIGEASWLPRASALSDIECTLIYDRALSPQEIKLLHADPLAPFRKRSTIVTSFADPPAEPEPVAYPIRTRTPRQTQPSLKSGYARSASESAFPGLWDGMAGAWVPLLGPTGLQALNASGNYSVDNGLPLHPINNATAGAVWSTSEHGPVLSFTNNDEEIELGTSRFSMGTDSVSIHAFVNSISGAASGFQGIFSKTKSDSVAKRYFVAVRESTADVRATFVSATNNAVNVDSTSDIRDAGWSSVTAVYNRRGGLALWINGVREGLGGISNYQGQDITDQTLVARVGAQSDASNNVASSFNGDLGAVFYYRRVLSPQEIKLLHADPLAPFRKRSTVILSTAVGAPPPSGSFRIYENYYRQLLAGHRGF